MIITITGKPCSGKSTIAEVFSKKYNFKLEPMGDIFRGYAKKFGLNSITNLLYDERILLVDREVDSYVEDVGKKHLEDDIIFVSRTAWFFIPKSFKVFLDVDIEIAAERLISDHRDSEPVKDKQEAKADLQQRWERENVRYRNIYNFDNTNLKNYDLVIATDNKPVEEIVEEIHTAYLKFLAAYNQSKKQ